MKKWITRLSHLHSVYSFLRSGYSSLRAAKDQISLEWKVEKLERRIAELEGSKLGKRRFPKKSVGEGTCDACCIYYDELFDFPAPGYRTPDGYEEPPGRYSLCEECFYRATVPPDEREPKETVIQKVKRQIKKRAKSIQELWEIDDKYPPTLK